MAETVKVRKIVINHLSAGGMLLTQIDYVSPEDVTRLLDLAAALADADASDGREVLILHGELEVTRAFLPAEGLARLLAESRTAMEIVAK